jgi:hypothetical protein
VLQTPHFIAHDGGAIKIYRFQLQTAPHSMPYGMVINWS